MKITIQKAEEQKPKKYPYMGIITSNGLMVLFTSEKRGISLNHSHHEFNTQITPWTESDFTTFNGTIKIEQ